MWIKTKDGRYYNLDKVTALDIKQSEKNSREYILYAIIDGKGWPLGCYRSVEKAQETMEDIMDAYFDDCVLYEMD